MQACYEARSRGDHGTMMIEIEAVFFFGKCTNRPNRLRMTSRERECVCVCVLFEREPEHLY